MTPTPQHQERAEAMAARITEYLLAGGLFNPEMMEHDKVRDLLMECRTTLLADQAECDELQGKLADAQLPTVEHVQDIYELSKLKAENTALKGSLRRIYEYAIDSEPIADAMNMQDIAKEALTQAGVKLEGV